MLLSFKDKKHFSIVSAGAGIILKEIVKPLGNKYQYHAIDILENMIKQEQKFPFMQCYRGKVGGFLTQIDKLYLIIAAQAFQWMDRPLLLTLSQAKKKNICSNWLH